MRLKGGYMRTPSASTPSEIRIQLLQEQLAGYESQCVKLHYEIARLTGERDTIKYAFISKI
jgi:hypothetical protein